MPTTKAHIKATSRYEKDAYFKTLVRFKKSDEEKIREAANGNLNGFIVDCVLNAINNGSSTQDSGAVPGGSDPDFAEYDEKRQQEELQAMLDAARARHATNNYEDREQKRRDTIAAASDINEGLVDYKKPDLDNYLND